MSKEINLARFPYHLRHDPNAICGYHAGYIGHSMEACVAFKTKVHEILDHRLLCFIEKPRHNYTYVIAETPGEIGHEYMGPPLHVQIPPSVA